MVLRNHLRRTNMSIMSLQFSYQLKEASVIDANATPPTIGKREDTTQRVGNCMHMKTKVKS